MSPIPLPGIRSCLRCRYMRSVSDGGVDTLPPAAVKQDRSTFDEIRTKIKVALFYG